jgi:hypothetical protein
MTEDKIKNRINELQCIADKLRSRNNGAATLAMRALDHAQQWLLEALETRKRGPFELDEDEAA